MSFEAERARIETYFRDQWALTSFASTVPIIWENTPVKQPTGDFIMHRIVEGEGRRAEINGSSTAFYRYIGLVQVDILATMGSGTSTSRQIADSIGTIYRGKQIIDGAGGVITFRAPTLRSMGIVSERYRTTVSLVYHRDIRQ